MNIFGRTAAVIVLIVASPLLCAIALCVWCDALCVWCDDRHQVLFRQLRVGQFGRRFTIYKFRTMRQNQTGLPITCAGDARITRVGRFLRAWKLDELPQLWNIARGEMAWVGPRPEVPEFVDMDDVAWRQVLQLRPGLADAATFAFRNEERLLAMASDPSDYYRREILPRKLQLSIGHSRRRLF